MRFLDDQMHTVREVSDAGAESAALSTTDSPAATAPQAQSLAQTDSPDEASPDESLNDYAKALSDLCHVLLNSSEFLYVD